MERRSRIHPTLRFAAGMSCFSLTLMMSTPGVQVARAGESESEEFGRFVEYARGEAQTSLAAPAEAPQGPSCSSAGVHAGPRSAADYSAHLQQAMDQLVARAGAAPTDLRPLSGRGQNYGQAPLRLDQALLRADLQR